MTNSLSLHTSSNALRGALRCHAQVDLGQLRSNLHTVRKLAPDRAVMAMVKANAYGHGIVECSRTLRNEGVEYLGVAFAEEGVQLRESGDRGNILVLSPPLPGEAAMFCEYQLEFVACDIDLVRAFEQAAAARSIILQAHLYLDTGMHRDGIFKADAPAFVDQMKDCHHVRLKGVCTHFATADATDKTFALEQLLLFNSVVDDLQQCGYNFELIHAANTAATSDLPQALFTMIRLGISLYGYQASAVINNPPEVKPILRLSARVNAVRWINPGESVSYGRRYTATKRERIATISLGYGDGFQRALSNRSSCLIRGKKFNLVGTICMDECMALVDESIMPGDEVVLIGRQGEKFQGADELALQAGTIPYEILSGISARVPRHYLDHQNPGKS